MKVITAILAALPLAVHAGGSNYGITPGTIAAITGKVSEWPVPTPRFARDPAIAPDGSIFITVMSGNKIARFDPKTEQMRVVKLPSTNGGIRKMVVDAQGKLWYMGSHNGRLGVIE